MTNYAILIGKKNYKTFMKGALNARIDTDNRVRVSVSYSLR